MNQPNAPDLSQAAASGAPPQAPGHGIGAAPPKKLSPAEMAAKSAAMAAAGGSGQASIPVAIGSGPPPQAFAIGGPPPVAPGMGGAGGGGGPPPNPMAPGGPPIPPPAAAAAAAVPQQPKRPLTGAEMAARSAAMAASYAPPVQPAAVQSQALKPKQLMPQRSMNFLKDIQQGTKLRSVGPIKREKPKDARSMLLANLKKGTTLKRVDPAQKQPKREEEVDRTVHAILQRRAFLEDDSDEESDESWGSESD